MKEKELLPARTVYPLRATITPRNISKLEGMGLPLKPSLFKTGLKTIIFSLKPIFSR